MGRKITDVAAQLDALIGELGLEKFAAADDPGTSHPAKQTDEGSDIQPAPEGARSAENTADVKKYGPAQMVDEAKNTDKKGKSDADVITDAKTTGKDPKVEQHYKGKADDPGTSHPADAAKNPEKYAELLNDSADSILAELEKMGTADEGGEAAPAEGEAAPAEAAPAEGEAAPAEGGEAAPAAGTEEGEQVTAEQQAELDKSASEFLTGYCKSAALLGELTADYLDGMTASLNEQKIKKAEGEEVPPEAAVEDQAAAEGAAGGEAAAAEELAALEAAIQQVAADLGISPEEVMQAVMAEMAGGGMGGEMGAEMGAGMGEMPKGASAVDLKAIEEQNKKIEQAIEKLAQNNASSLQALENAGATSDNSKSEIEKKAKAYDELMAKVAAAKSEESQRMAMAEALTIALDNYVKKAAQAEATAQ